MKNLYRILGILLLFSLFSGCNDSDDTTAIFTGKTWKLNLIAVDGGHTMYDFWEGNTEAQEKSLKLLSNTGTYTLTFEGLADGDNIQGKVSGTIITSSLQGTWNANGKNNSFRATVTGPTDNGDKLAKNFIEGLNNAIKYEGDTNNLYILYKPQSAQRTFRMFFKPVK